MCIRDSFTTHHCHLQVLFFLVLLQVTSAPSTNPCGARPDRLALARHQDLWRTADSHDTTPQISSNGYWQALAWKVSSNIPGP
eukprot:5269383-Pyramimonas_sp.AAC.1